MIDEIAIPKMRFLPIFGDRATFVLSPRLEEIAPAAQQPSHREVRAKGKPLKQSQWKVFRPVSDIKPSPRSEEY
jgi:hypothetical protein